MHRLLFRNRFNALVFVAIILFSVRILVGTDREDGALESVTARFNDEGQTVATQQDRIASPPPVTVRELAPDEEMIEQLPDDTADLDAGNYTGEESGEIPDEGIEIPNEGNEI